MRFFCACYIMILINLIGGYTMANICNYPSCKEVSIHEGRCSQHERPQRKKKYHKHQFDKQGRYIYSSSRWVKLSKRYRMNNPFCECERCKASGLARNADLVDHIIEIKDGGAIYDEDNLMSMSKACHAYKTAQAAKARRRQGLTVDNFKF